MCNICYANENNISSIEANPRTLCANHYQDWANEKTLGEEYYV
jgi:hypothetical protein